MWFFMITCYIASFLTLAMLIVSGLQGYFGFSVLNANHPTFALLTIIVYLFTETLIIFFFVGVGISIKEYVLEKHLPVDFHKKSIAIKRRVYPPILLNILLMMILFISGGAVDTGRIPVFSHTVLYFVGLGHFLKTLAVEHVCFKESTSIVLEMSGVTQGISTVS